MNSLPTIEQVNRENLIQVIQKLDPELYMIKIALEETNVNAMIIPHVIRAIANMTYGAGYGKIQIFMQAKIITQIKPEESTEVNEPAVK